MRAEAGRVGPGAGERRRPWAGRCRASPGPLESAPQTGRDSAHGAGLGGIGWGRQKTARRPCPAGPPAGLPLRALLRRLPFTSASSLQTLSPPVSSGRFSWGPRSSGLQDGPALSWESCVSEEPSYKRRGLRSPSALGLLSASGTLTPWTPVSPRPSAQDGEKGRLMRRALGSTHHPHPVASHFLFSPCCLQGLEILVGRDLAPSGRAWHPGGREGDPVPLQEASSGSCSDPPCPPALEVPFLPPPLPG